MATAGKPASSSKSPLDLRVILAFFAIYFIWGTTFFAIRIVVAEMPPLLAAGVRFFVAGVVLYGFMRLRGTAAPAARQWRNMLVMSLLMFVADYAALFWAEQYIASGIAAVLLATIPLLTLVMEIILLPKKRLSWMILVSTLLGFAGVVILLLPGTHASLRLLPCLAILGGATAWAMGIVLSRSMDLPISRPVCWRSRLLPANCIERFTSR